MSCQQKSKIKKQQDNSQNASSKSYTVLAMALTATLAVLALFIATFILLQLKFKEPLEITLSDWLKMIIPIAGGAIITIFAFLGVDRLKDFDERQDKLAKELRNDLKSQVDNAVKLVQPRLNETYQEWETSLQQKLSEYDKSFGLVAERIDKYDKIIGSVEKLEEVTDAIGNVAEVHSFIAKLFSDTSASTSDKSQRTRILLALIERVKCGDIKGDSADYHNLASELARQNYFEFAADVTQKGLDIFDDNIDLLSDYTYYSHKAGRKIDVNDGLSRLEKIEREIWNWRAFTFYIDVVNDGEANEENKEKALQCVKAYKQVLPDEERAYMAEYETLKKYGELGAAESALVMAETNLTMTAQCSLTLSEIYHMRGDYDKAINSATRAILGQAETQPSSNTGAAFAHRGFSKDAKIHKAIIDGVSIETQYAEIHSAICDYRMAIQLGYSYANIAVRIKILEELLPSEVQEEEFSVELEKRIEKLEFTLAILIKKLTTDDEE
ncbi:MAG: hypothetical protein ACI4TK_05545 [Agathobacter sp.]